ncbi:hypothetical protein MVEN_02524400 [Mycena venus]|uniref:Uncharacterized protein n=1 Tax=Mycena venus TaxID=2733690 RepID=A0A8H7C9B5_9AGAR|nr:hypothetical protein MVEN_02524400 [Mycena venus]
MVRLDSMSLKERIAALQQKEDRDREQRARATSPQPPVTHGNGAPAVALPASASAGALRAKIAQFESKGPVPVPRGSFGMGAPPESAAPKRRADGMLYGNRMQPARIPSATLGVAGLARPSEAFSAVDPRAVPLPESLPGTPISPPASFSHTHSFSSAHADTHGHGHGHGHGGRETPEFLRPKEREDKKAIVQARGTAFNTALDIARKAEADIKAERRKSAHWLTPQHTGGALLPQFTGSSGITAQYTGGSGTLTPQNTGGGKLTPQNTGSSLTLAPQLTGNSILSSPPLSPLGGYSPRGFASPPMSPSRRERTISGLALDSSPSSNSKREARLSLFSPSMEPLTLGEVDADADGPLSPRVLIDGQDHDDNVFVAEPAEGLEEKEEERAETEKVEEQEPEVESTPTSVPTVDGEQEQEPAKDFVEETSPIPIPVAQTEPIPEPAPVPVVDPHTEPEREPAAAGELASIDTHTHTSRASIDTHASDAPSSPDSAYPGFDLDAHLRARAAGLHAHPHLTNSSTASLEDDSTPAPEGPNSRPSSVVSVDQPERSGFDDDVDRDPNGEGEDGEVFLPLPNTLHTHAFRAHLSTITERTSISWGGTEAGSPPGSAAWDGRFGVYAGDQDERRYSGGRDERWGAGEPDVEDRHRASVYTGDEAASNPPGSAFVDGFADADKERERERDGDGDGDGAEKKRDRFSVGGYAAARGAYGAFGNGNGGADMATVRPRPRPTASRPAYSAGSFGSLGALAQNLANSNGSGATYDSAVDTSTNPEFQTPSDAVIYSGVGSPYRLSGLTERGYTPSLRSRSSSHSEEVHGGEYEERGGEDDEEERGEERTEEAGREGVEPPTPTPPQGEGEDVDVDPRTPTEQQPEEQSHHDSLLSARDSMTVLSAAPSQRDSLSASQRDSFSSTHTQVISLRPLSVLSDGGSPSHVALAHRVPVAEEVAALGVARAVFIPSLRLTDSALDAEDPESQSPTQRSPRQLPTPPSQRPDLARSNSSPGAPRASSASASMPTPSQPRAAEELAPARRRYGYTTGVQRPHTEYIPPAPDSDEEGDVMGEFGTVSFGFGEGSTGKRGFRAVVHGRVREAGGSSSRPNGGSWSAGQSHDLGSWGSHQSGSDKRLPDMPPQTPLSPGYASADLAELLAEAAALEQRLERGELPGEALRRMSMRPPPRSSASANAGTVPPMPPIPQMHTSAEDAVRPARSSSLRSMNPLSRSRSDRRKDRNKEEKRAGPSSSMGNLLQMQDALSSSASAPAGFSADSNTSTSMPALTRSKSSSQVLTPIPVSPSPSSINEVPPTPPPKSPGSRYFSSFRRLASTNRGFPGGGRTSVSSSEDSMGLPTPPDGYDGLSVNASAGHHAAAGGAGHPASPQTNLSPHGSPHIGGIAWPTLASKKSVGSLGKSAASLAGKMWHRSRSKSNTSTVSSLSEGASSPPPPMPVPVPALPSPPVLKLDVNSNSPSPFVIPPIQTSLDGDDPLADSPTSSTPIADPLSSRLPPGNRAKRTRKNKIPPHITRPAARSRAYFQ